MSDEGMVPEQEMGTGMREAEETTQDGLTSEPEVIDDMPPLDEAMMTPENQGAMEPPVGDEEMSADDVGMMEDEGMVDLNGGMQCEAEEIPEDDSGMVIDEPGMMIDDPGMVGEPDPIEPWVDVPQGVPLVPAPEGLIEASMLEEHPLANYMPVKSKHEYEALKESIRINGLQQSLTRFEGKVLDGRHRRRICDELGIPVAVMDFVGSADDALIHVLQANQYHHDYSVSQRAAIAALLVPEIAEMVNRGRIDRLRRTLELKRQGECPIKLSDTPGEVPERTESCRIAGRMMRVSPAYVGRALRIQREAPELFEQMHAGKITIQAALKTLNGETDDAQQREAKAARSELNRALKNLDRHPDFLTLFHAFMAQFAE